MVMREIARNALVHVLGAMEGQHLLIVTDEQRIEIGNAFDEAGEALGLEGRLFVLADVERPVRELPKELRRTIEWADILVNVFVAYPEETPFRVALIKEAASAGARVGHGPGITDDMMLDGAMRVDFPALRGAGELMLEKLAGAVRVHVTTPAGTDLWLMVQSRAFEHDVGVPPGRFGNLPNGEVRVAPIETEVRGTLVADSTVGDLGTLPTPVTLEVVAGRIASISSRDEGLVERIHELTSLDEGASIVGELGLGINPSARVIGNMLEDEKVAGTVHVAFGNNAEMPGGQNTSATHRDFLLLSPTLTVELEDGRTREIVKEGRIL